jgi:DNA-binding winged helix-turn-helix (wHTH) protein/TolB-like protein
MIYRFNNIELDTTNFRLTVDLKEVSVEPQVFNLIVHLIQNKNKIVSRHEILDKVWKGRVVSDTSINNHIKTARKVLGDDGQRQQVIKTIHSRGYQFISETEELSDVSTNTKPVGGIKVQKFPIKTTYVLSGILIAAILVLFSLFWRLDNQINNTEHQNNAPVYVNLWGAQQHIAVLPFTNAKPDVHTDYLGFALANQIIGDLVYLDKFTIRPAGSIRKYVEQTIDPILVGKELKVDYVLNGNYLKENNIIRLNVELVSMTNNEIIWREMIEVDYSNTFALQDLVASKVAVGLNASFTSKGINRKYRDTPNSALAYEYYLRGISYPFSNKGHKMAVEMLEKSIQLDANFAPSYAHLGNHKRLLEQHGRVVPEGVVDTEWYYKKALELNPELLEALSNLSVFYTETNRIEQAFIITRKMIKINPNSADSHFSLGYIYRYAGMLDEAISEMETALAISPNNTRFRSIISTYISAGKYQLALSKIHLDKGDYGIGYSGIIAFEQEKEELALRYFNQVLEIDSEGIWGLIARVYIAVIQKDNQTGLLALNRMIDTNIEDAENTYYFADFYALLGEKDKSIEMLNKAVSTGYFNYPHIVQNPAFDFMLEDAKFIRILDVAKKRHEAFREKFL